MRGDNDRTLRPHNVFAVLSGNGESCWGFNGFSMQTKAPQRHKFKKCEHDGHSAYCCCGREIKGGQPPPPYLKELKKDRQQTDCFCLYHRSRYWHFNWLNYPWCSIYFSDGNHNKINLPWWGYFLDAWLWCIMLHHLWQVPIRSLYSHSWGQRRSGYKGTYTGL